MDKEVSDALNQLCKARTGLLPVLQNQDWKIALSVFHNIEGALKFLERDKISEKGLLSYDALREQVHPDNKEQPPKEWEEAARHICVSEESVLVFTQHVDRLANSLLK